MRRRQLLLIPVFVLLVAARQRAVHRTLPADAVPPIDVYSFSEPAKITVRHLELDLTVDFDARRLHGSATLHLNNKTATRTLVLDTRNLTIERVTLDDGRAALYSIGAATSNGAPMTIGIEPSTRSVKIDYTTISEPPGLAWTTAQQSLGRTRPWVYSQNEPIEARSWIPLQDTPTVRMTYDATLRVPPGMLALMSAENPTVTNTTGVYTFRMPYAIPSYLIAFAVGRLEFRPLDERTGVYAEPELIDDAHWELSYIPDMVDAAERIAGPYPFGRYDVLMMPPTYAAGGMENPRLNFINPFAVITGNRPARPFVQVLIAHELAHSWAGDQTTLATWHDVWLNEGIATYLQERIVEELDGAERAQHSFYSHRRNAVSATSPSVDPRVTLMHRPSTANENPIAAFSLGAYTKGALFMKTLEDLLGRATFDAWLREYFTRFAWRWVDDQSFLAFLGEKGLDRAELRVREWIYEPGLPSNVTAPTQSALNDRASAAAAAFRSGTPMTSIVTPDWHEIDILLFVAAINGSRARLDEVDAVLHLSSRTTPPQLWMTTGIAANYAPVLPAVERVLRRGGPNSQVISLYATLVANPAMRALARRIFDESRDRYDAALASNIEAMLRSVGALAYEEAA